MQNSNILGDKKNNANNILIKMGDKMYDYLNEIINNYKNIKSPIDIEICDYFIWGYICARHDETFSFDFIFKKLIAVNQAVNYFLISKKQKFDIIIEILSNPNYQIPIIVPNLFEDLDDIFINKKESSLSFDIKTKEIQRNYELAMSSICKSNNEISTNNTIPSLEKFSINNIEDSKRFNFKYDNKDLEKYSFHKFENSDETILNKEPIRHKQKNRADNNKNNSLSSIQNSFLKKLNEIIPHHEESYQINNNKASSASFPGDSKESHYVNSTFRKELSEIYDKINIVKKNKHSDAFIVQKIDYIIKNKANCPTCFEPIGSNDTITLSACKHIIHFDCFMNYISYSINSGKFPILCFEENCKKEIEIKDYYPHLYENLAEKFEINTFRFYINKYPNDYSWCYTPECGYIFINCDSSSYTCPKCKKKYCVLCKVIYHFNQTCEEYQKKYQEENNETKFDYNEYFKKKKYQNCPKCKYWIEKINGCNEIKCHCGVIFCYFCGKTGGLCGYCL